MTGIGRGGKRRVRRVQVPALIWVGLVLAILLGVYGDRLPLLDRVEWWIGDLRMDLLQSHRPEHPKIAIATITDYTMTHTARRSPIDRRFLARLLAKLDEAKPAAIAIDILMDQKTSDDEDDELRRQLHAMTVPVLVADGNPTTDPDQITKDGARFLSDFFASIDNKLVQPADVRLHPDTDNVVRTVPEASWLGSNDAMEPSLWSGAVAATGWPGMLPSGRIAYYGAIDQKGDDFEKILSDVIANFSGPAWELMKPKLAGRIVFVGSYVLDADRHDTPFILLSKSQTSGVIIQASLAAQMVDGRWIRTPLPIEMAVLTILVVLACFLIGVRSNNNWITLGAVSLVLLIVWAAGIAAYAWPVDGGLGRSMYPLVAPSFAGLIATALGYALTRRQFADQRNFIQGALATYVSASVAKQLLDDPSLLSVSGDRREISALFTDIEGFTTLSEELEAATLVDILNRYLEGMTRIVLAHDGLLDKYIGDAVVALWNADVPRADHAAKAVDCALELARFSAGFAAEERQAGIPFGRTRIGVQTGYAVVGNFGGARKLNFTAIGDTMNLTSRLEGANKHLGTTILVGGAAAERSGRTDLRPIADLVVKGKDEAVAVFGPVPNWSAELLDRYKKAYAALEACDPDAENILRELADEHDPIIHLYLQRLAAGKQGTRIVLDEK
jgi:class 3 adenylate cyclase/CHASE2 domain-containing sensor protein